jgi:hypothetical protein
MPIISAAALPSVITGGASVLGSILGNIGAGKRQRKADKANIKFWQMQNAYNDPAQQMARLKKAGLNPNLVYGQSVSGATGQAGAVAPSKAAPYSMDLGSAANNAMSAYQTSAQVNNVDVDTAKKAFDLGIDKKYAAETIEQSLTNVRLGNALKVIENNVQSGIMQDRIKLAAENLAIAKATLRGKQLQNAISDFDADMKDMNVSGNSWAASIMKLILGTGKDLGPKILQKGNQVMNMLPEKKKVIKKEKIYKY